MVILGLTKDIHKFTTSISPLENRHAQTRYYPYNNLCVLTEIKKNYEFEKGPTHHMAKLHYKIYR